MWQEKGHCHCTHNFTLQNRVTLRHCDVTREITYKGLLQLLVLYCTPPPHDCVQVLWDKDQLDQPPGILFFPLSSQTPPIHHWNKSQREQTNKTRITPRTRTQEQTVKTRINRKYSRMEMTPKRKCPRPRLLLLDTGKNFRLIVKFDQACCSFASV